MKTEKPDPIKTSLLDRWVVGSQIIDLGCGIGLYADYLARQGKKVVGVDSDAKLLKAARKNKRKGEFVHGQADKLPFKDKSFDTALLLDILEHNQEEGLVKEAIRVTRQRLLITVPRTTDKALLKNFLVFGHHLDRSHRRTYDQKSARKLLKNHGLKRLAIKPVHPVSTDSLMLEIFKAPLWLRRGVRKLAFILLTPKKFYANLFIAAQVEES